MSIEEQECSAKVCGKGNVLLVIGLQCQMWKFNGTLTGISKSTDLSLFVMAQNHVNTTSRAKPDLSRIRIGMRTSRKFSMSEIPTNWIRW